MIKLDHNNGRSSVGLWTDDENKSYLFQSIKSKQPTYEDSTIKFDGGSHELIGFIDEFDTSACAVYIIASTPVESGEVILATFFDINDRPNSDNYLQFGFVDSKPTVWYGDGSSRQMLQGSPVDATTISTYRFISNGSERVLKRDGSQIDSSTTAYVSTINALSIGSNGRSIYGRCSVRSVNYFDQSKNDSEDSNLTSEYNSKYSVSLAGPTVDNPNLSFLGIGQNQMDISWEEAYDDNTGQSSLTYYVYRSTSDNMNSVTDAENNGTLLTSGDGLSQYTSSGLSEDTLYYFQVIVEDGVGNKTAYISNGQTTDAQGGSTSQYVTTDGIYFSINGQQRKMAGSNAYWLPTYMKQAPTYVDDFFDAAQAANIDVVRIWGFYNGDPQYEGDITLQPDPGVYHEEDLQRLDAVIQKAKNHNMYVTLSLNNYWLQLGGVDQYNLWAGETNPESDRMSKFINGNQQQQWFRDYISMLINRTNQVTGQKYKNEPAIFSWEIINEARNPGVDPVVLRDWYQDIAQFIKSEDPNHMVTTGEEGYEHMDHNQNYTVNDYSNTYCIANDNGTSFQLNTEIPEIDFGQHHWYPLVFGWSTPYSTDVGTATEAWFNDHQAIAESQGKPVLCGEYGWEADPGFKDVTPGWWSIIESSKTACDIYWALVPDGSHLSSGLSKNDEYSGNIVYPNDNVIFDQLTTHANNMWNALQDSDPPSIGDSILQVSSVTTQSFIVSFSQATDNYTNTLTYKLYTSSSDNVGTVSNAENNGTLNAEGTGVTELTASGFSVGETVYFNIVVQDDAGNKSAYTSTSVTTSSSSPAINMSHSLATGLVAYHQFYEGSGTQVADISSNTHHIATDLGSVNANWDIFNGKPVLQVVSATDNHIAFPDHADFNPSGNFSIGMFLAYSQYGNLRNALIDGGGNADGFSLRQKGWNNQIDGYIGSVNYEQSVSSFKNDSTIHQLVITVNQTNETYSVYRDGSAVVSDKSYPSTQSGTINNFNSNWFLGSFGADSDNPPADTWWHRFAWWNRELTAQEVSDWNADKDLMLE